MLEHGATLASFPTRLGATVVTAKQSKKLLCFAVTILGAIG